MLTQAGRIGSGYPSDLRLGLQFATGFETHLVLAMHRTNVAVWTGDKPAERRSEATKSDALGKHLTGVLEFKAEGESCRTNHTNGPQNSTNKLHTLIVLQR